MSNLNPRSLAYQRICCHHCGGQIEPHYRYGWVHLGGQVYCSTTIATPRRW